MLPHSLPRRWHDSWTRRIQQVSAEVCGWISWWMCCQDMPHIRSRTSRKNPYPLLSLYKLTHFSGFVCKSVKILQEQRFEIEIQFLQFYHYDHKYRLQYLRSRFTFIPIWLQIYSARALAGLQIDIFLLGRDLFW